MNSNSICCLIPTLARILNVLSLFFLNIFCDISPSNPVWVFEFSVNFCFGNCPLENPYNVIQLVFRRIFGRLHPRIFPHSLSVCRRRSACCDFSNANNRREWLSCLTQCWNILSRHCIWEWRRSFPSLGNYGRKIWWSKIRGVLEWYFTILEMNSLFLEEGNVQKLHFIVIIDLCSGLELSPFFLKYLCDISPSNPVSVFEFGVLSDLEKWSKQLGAS